MGAIVKEELYEKVVISFTKPHYETVVCNSPKHATLTAMFLHP